MAKTQEGKTTWVREYLCPQLPYYIIFDTKQVPKDNLESLGVVCNNIEQLRRAINRKEKIVFRPDFELDDDEEKDLIDQACGVILQTTNYVVIFDELADVSDSFTIGKKHLKILTKGLGRGIRHVGCCQRPAKILNATILNQSDAYVYFRLGDGDYNRFKSVLPHLDKVKQLTKFQWIYTDGIHWEIHDPINLGGTSNVKSEPKEEIKEEKEEAESPDSVTTSDTITEDSDSDVDDLFKLGGNENATK